MKTPRLPSRFWAFAFAALLSPELAWSETRIFKSPDGRTIEGEILQATVDMVTLKTTAGVTIAAAASKFSEEDQAYIAEWRKQNPKAIRYDFDVLFSKDKQDRVKGRSRGAVSTTLESWICNMKIRNKSGETLTNLTVDYIVYYDAVDGNQKITRNAKGSTQIESIKHLQELVKQTDPVELTVTQLDAGYYYADGSRSRQRDSISGLSLSLSHEGKKVFSWASQNAPVVGSGAKGSAFK